MLRRLNLKRIKTNESICNYSVFHLQTQVNLSVVTDQSSNVNSIVRAQSRTTLM